jgi:hypothetical protein
MNERKEEEELLLATLPGEYKYKVIRYELHENNLNDVKFTLETRVNVCDKSDVKVFLAKLNESSCCTFNVQSGKPDRSSDSATARRVLTGFRKCCMNIAGSEDKENKQPLQPGKNTNCGANLKFRLENAVAKNPKERKDKESFPLWVLLEFVHNHSLKRAEYLKYLSVSDETRSAFTEMFQEGFSPSTAHAEMRRSIKTQYPDTWPEMFADRSKLPGIFWCFYWHRVWMNKVIGSREGVDAFNKAQDMVKEFDMNCKRKFPLPDSEFYAKIAQSEQGQTVVVIIDPFMRRVHQTIPQSAELCFIDATSSLDRNDTKLFHLLSSSVIGGLPLAEILTTREDTETIVFALQLLKTILPAGAFCDRGGILGPQLFMSDDSDALRNALSKVWPSAELLLCTFHILQAQWNWLWDGKHSVEKQDRPVLLNLFKRVLYAEDDGELSERLEDMYADPICLKYPQYQSHLMVDTFPKMKAWSLSHRISQKLPTSNNNTNNIVEASFRYTKEDQFNRHKAYNLPDLLSILLDESEFYAFKCVDAGNNRIESWLRNCHSKYISKLPDIDPDRIRQLGEHTYLVPSETDPDRSYLVDMDMRLCSCPMGQLRGPCKHKRIVAMSKMVPSFDVLPTKHPLMRQKFMYLGTGTNIDIDWFLPMQSDIISSDQPIPGIIGEAVPANHEQVGQDQHREQDVENTVTVTPPRYC